MGDAISLSRDGRIVAVGEHRLVTADLPRGAEIHHLDGTLVPAFVDAHTHVRAAASARLAADCSTDTTLDSLLATVRRAASGVQAGDWVTVTGLESANFSSRLPDRAELDAAVPRNPVRIRHRSLHGWLLNGLAAAQVESATGSPLADGIVVDDDGLLGRTIGRVSAPSSIERAVRDWSRERLAQGVVAILDATVGNGAEQVDALSDWRRSGVLAQNVRALTGDPEVAPSAMVIGRKLMPVPGASAGALREEITDAWSSHELVAIHCVEAETLGAIIEAVDGIDPTARRRLRIEHASLCPPEWLARVAAIGAVVITHPAFIAAHGDRYRRELPTSTLDWLYRLRSWVAHGVGLAVGSDEPAGPGDPLAAWRTAISRRTGAGESLGPAESLDPATALAALGEWPARASGFLDLGRLEPGSLGAAVCLRGDPFGSEPEAVSVAAVVAGGRLLGTP